MPTPKLTPELLEAIQADLLKTAAENGDDPIEVSTHGPVSLKMDRNFTVTAVSIRGADMGREQRVALETAMLECMNDAIVEVTRRNTDFLARSIDRLSSQEHR